MKNSNVKEILIISLKLLVICALVAAIVASVNLITAPTISKNLKISTANTLTEIYKNDVSFEKYFSDGAQFMVSEEKDNNEFIIKNGDEIILKCSDVEFERVSQDENEEIKNLYVLKDGKGKSLGYCIAVEPSGYKDVIKLLISIDSNAVVKSVKIVEMKETKGIGTRAIEDNNPPADKNGDKGWFLNQFVGLGSDKISSSDIIPIAKATKTSRPIIKAVNTSVKQIKAFIKVNGGAKR